MMLSVVCWLKRIILQNLWGSTIRSKVSKAGGDRTTLLCMGETVASRIAFSSWYRLVKEFWKIRADVYGEPTACKTLFYECSVD